MSLSIVVNIDNFFRAHERYLLPGWDLIFTFSVVCAKTYDIFTSLAPSQPSSLYLRRPSLYQETHSSISLTSDIKAEFNLVGQVVKPPLSHLPPHQPVRNRPWAEEIMSSNLILSISFGFAVLVLFGYIQDTLFLGKYTIFWHVCVSFLSRIEQHHCEDKCKLVTVHIEETSIARH